VRAVLVEQEGWTPKKKKKKKGVVVEAGNLLDAG
jgi:hypothetical protein